MRRTHVFLLVIPLALAGVLIAFNPLGVRDRAGNALEARSSAAADSSWTTPSPPGVGGSQRNKSVAKLPVEGVIVAPSDFTLTVAASGRAEAKRRVELAPRVGERVKAVHVTEGDWVAPGSLLAELDSRTYEIALAESRAAEANAQADAQVRLLNDSNATEEKRAMVADRSGLTAARQQVARAEFDLESTRVTAPFAGHVSRVDAVPGALISANQPILTLVDLSTLRLPAEVLESSFGNLSTGSTATLTFPALPGRAFTGKVTALSPEVDPERGTGIAYIDIPNPEGLIKPGMFAEAEIASNTFANTLSVPRAAVLERERRLLVFKSVKDRAEWQYVDTGMETDDRIEITSGLAPGDTVLTEGHLTLAHAAPIRVRVVEDQP